MTPAGTASGGGPRPWMSRWGARKDPSVFYYFNDQHFNPAQGVLGGTDARPSNVFKVDLETGEKTQLDQFGQVDLTSPRERFLALNSTGGGYGDPLERDPELVRWDVREEIVSLERARDIYGVIIDTGQELYAVDQAATEKRRQELRQMRGSE